MPLLVYSNADFQPFTKIRSAGVNAKFSDIQTLLNTTKLDDTNIQDDGITRATKLKAGTAKAVVINDSSGDLTDSAVGTTGLVAVGDDTAGFKFSAAGTQNQLLKSNGTTADPSWVDNPTPEPSHLIRSGAITADGQQDFIRPDGGGADDFSVLGLSTDLVYVVENTSYTLTSDVNVTGLDAPSATNNTASLNDPRAADEEWTARLGEEGPMSYDGGGTNFLPTGYAGNRQAFKINDGASDEYFTGRFTLDATSTAGDIVDCRRGYYVDSAGAAIPRLPVADNDTLTIMALYWVFIDTSQAVTTTDLEPIYAYAEPTGISTGQKWFNLSNNTWNNYNGASFDNFAATLIGEVIVDENDEVVGARSSDFYSIVNDCNTIKLEDFSATKVRGALSCEVSVKGVLVSFTGGAPEWDITNTDQRVGTEDASTYYSLYITNDRKLKLEATFPYARPDLKGMYHPHKPWRMVGEIYNDGSSDITHVSDEISSDQSVKLDTPNGHGATNTYIRRYTNITSDLGTMLEYADSANDGMLVTARRRGTLDLGVTDARSGGDGHFGYSINSSALTTDIRAISASERLIYTDSPSGLFVNAAASTSVTVGDKVRVHTNSTVNNTSDEAQAVCTFSRDRG